MGGNKSWKIYSSDGPKQTSHPFLISKCNTLSAMKSHLRQHSSVRKQLVQEEDSMAVILSSV